MRWPKREQDQRSLTIAQMTAVGDKHAVERGR